MTQSGDRIPDDLRGKQLARDALREHLPQLTSPNDAELRKRSAVIVAQKVAKAVVGRDQIDVSSMSPEGFAATKERAVVTIQQDQRLWLDLLSDYIAEQTRESINACLRLRGAKTRSAGYLRRLVKDDLSDSWRGLFDIERKCIEIVKRLSWQEVKPHLPQAIMACGYDLLREHDAAPTAIREQHLIEVNLLATAMVRPEPAILKDIEVADQHRLDEFLIRRTPVHNHAVRLTREIGPGREVLSFNVRSLLPHHLFVPFQNQDVYPLLKAFHSLVDRIQQDRGPIFTNLDPDSPTRARIPNVRVKYKGVLVSSLGLLPTHRRITYRRYDQLIAIYLGMACIEGLVRSLAQANGLKVWQRNRPVGVDRLTRNLSSMIPADIVKQLSELVSPDRSNLRHQLAHALLAASDILDTAELLETVLASVYGLDDQIRLAEADLEWRKDFQLDTDEVRLLGHLRDDFLDENNANYFQQRFLQQVANLEHSHSRLLRLCSMNYLKRPEQVLDYYWVSVVTGVLTESFFRHAVWESGSSGVQIRAVGDSYDMQWLTLDQDRGLLDQTYVQQLLIGVKLDDPQVFQRSLTILIKLRNAATHGAWPDQDAERNYQLCKMFIKFCVTLSEVLSRA